MVPTRSVVGTTSSTSAIISQLQNSWTQQSDVSLQMKTRRMFTTPDRDAWNSAATGTLIPHPFNEAPMTVRTLIGAGTKAVYIATSRLTANQPDIAVIPLSATSSLSATIGKLAGEQERLDNQMWYENGGGDAQWQAAWAKSIGGAAFWLTLPRDADFGLPDREYYDEDDDALNVLRAAGKISAVPYGATETGKLVYAEHGDVWAARRKEASQQRAMDGRSLFTLSTYPRDMVLKERDRESKDLKWAAIVEEIPVSDCVPGSDYALSLAKANGIDVASQDSWGIFWDAEHKKIIGGISRGGPLNSQQGVYDAFTLIRRFDREEMVILVAPRGSIYGATEIYRGPHGCKVQGQPSCPVVEDPFYRTDVSVTGKEYATALDPVFKWLAPINQMMTLKSLVALYNSTPRLVGKLNAGADLSDDDGQPIGGNSAPAPGMDASEIAWYPGEVTQLLIRDESMLDTLKLCLEQLEAVMPSLGSDASGADAPGWALQMRIQEQQEPYREPVRNTCQAITGIIQRWHGWMKQLDTPICFFAAPGSTKGKRESRGLIEFDPKNLVDSIRVTQDVSTPSEATVRIQIGMQQWQAGLIDDEEYYDKYAREQDSREAVIRRWVQIVTNYVMTGTLPPAVPGGVPGGSAMVQIVADAVRGAVHYEMVQKDDNYAIAVAEQLVQQGNQQQMPTGEGNVADAAGVRVPGMGMSTTLDGQLGGAAPNAGNPGQLVPA